VPPPRAYNPCIYFRNAAGQDLLDSSTDKHYNLDSIYTYVQGTNYRAKGEIVTITPVYSMPVGHALSIVSYVRNETWIIQLSKSDLDTMTLVYSKSNLDKIYYNNKIVTPALGSSFPEGTYFPITITKSP